jgi:glucose-1-phosphate thymidylyltransferase
VPILELANSRPDWAWIGLKEVPDPQRYGVATLRNDRIVAIEEKPPQPASPYAVVGIYIYPPDVFGIIKTLKPSARGELEITDVNNHYLRQGRLGHFFLEGYWTDAGTLDSLDYANHLVRAEPPRF